MAGTPRADAKGTYFDQVHQPSKPELPERRWIMRRICHGIALTISYRAFPPLGRSVAVLLQTARTSDPSGLTSATTAGSW
jgi:hypothetical protein